MYADRSEGYIADRIDGYIVDLLFFLGYKSGRWWIPAQVGLGQVDPGPKWVWAKWVPGPSGSRPSVPRPKS